MAQVPPPGGAAGEYWVVYWTPSQAQVSSRLVNTPAPGTGATFGFTVEPAATADQARALAEKELGTSAIITRVEGPYDSANAARAAGNAAQNQNEQAQQAGHLPNPFHGLNLGNWLKRIAEILIGLGLIVVSVAKLANGTPVGRAATTAGKAAHIL